MKVRRISEVIKTKKIPFRTLVIFTLIVAMTGILFSIHTIGTSYSLSTYYDNYSIENLAVKANDFTFNILKQRSIIINLLVLPHHLQSKIILSSKISFFVAHINLYYQIQRAHIHIARLKAG
ncbi:MAG: hypothetical protein HPY74_14940 [Firmicutes bacterium]|nr:hypothetical protein [Bacillota bacterium]